MLFSDENGVKHLVIEPAGAGAPARYTAVAPAGATRAADFVGRYGSDEVPAEWEVVAHEDRLYLRAPRAAEVAMRPLFRDGFAAGPTVRFERDPSGAVTAMTVTTRGVQALRMRRK